MSGEGPLSPGWRVGPSAFEAKHKIGTVRNPISAVRHKAESLCFHDYDQIAFVF